MLSCILLCIYRRVDLFICSAMYGFWIEVMYLLRCTVIIMHAFTQNQTAFNPNMQKRKMALYKASYNSQVQRAWINNRPLPDSPRAVFPNRSRSPYVKVHVEGDPRNDVTLGTHIENRLPRLWRRTMSLLISQARTDGNRSFMQSIISGAFRERHRDRFVLLSLSLSPPLLFFHSFFRPSERARAIAASAPGRK